jgi:hypothetical protein
VKRELSVPVAVVVTAVIAATTASAALAGGSGRPISHAALWQDPGLSVICGVENPALSKTKVLCQGTGIPRPPHSSPNEGDPAVTLAASGKPQLVLISQDSYIPGATAKNLGAGRTWSSRGVRCTTSVHGVKCTNAQKHGFTLRNHHYRAF